MIPAGPLRGGCQCGAIRYELDRKAIETLYVCHCTQCQRQSSSAFGMSLRMGREGVTFRGTPPLIHLMVADSGLVKHGGFCGDCGTRLYHAPADGPTLNIKPGTLDDTSWLRPVGHLWTDSAQPWVTVPACMLTFPRQPDAADMERMIALWAARQSA